MGRSVRFTATNMVTRVVTILVTLGGMLLVAACSTQGVKNSAPEWVLKPGEGVVASCGFHIKGHHAQQECALQRARERLAARQGVAVSSVSYLKERVNNDRVSIKLDKETHSEVSSVTVKGQVKDTWYDAQRDEYYVWMFAR